MIHGFAFLAGFIGRCPENWPFRWPPRPKGFGDVMVDILAGGAGIGGGVLAQRFVGADANQPLALVATLAVAFVAGGAVRQVASYIGPTPQPAVGGVNVPNVA